MTMQELHSCSHD